MGAKLAMTSGKGHRVRMEPIAPIPLVDIQAARGRISKAAVRTPMLRLDMPDLPREVWLKLECLQPIGSFKIRGAANAMALADPDLLARGVYTGSAGNMAQGVAFNARRLGIPCRVIVPDSAPRTKVDAIARLGGTAVRVPFDEWWSVLENHGHPDEEGFFVHPVSDPGVIAGNGTIGIEILEQLPETAAVVVPFGGGGLSSGIACALGALRPGLPVFAAEVSTAAPLTASLEAGEPVEIDRIPTFVDGIGGKGVLTEMWPLVSSVLAGTCVVSTDEICQAIRLLAERAHVVAEGAGGASVAAALKGLDDDGDGPIVAVVSGGNIDRDVLATIIEGGTP
jgi:threonine dehydratase